MLFVIDMQNEYVDKENGEKYVPGAEKLVEGIIEKIKEYEEKDEYIFYTIDISQEDVVDSDLINDKKNIDNAENKADQEKKWACQPFDLLKPYLEKHEIIKKSYYALPPETLKEIQDYFKDKGEHIGNIEFLGVETDICVLANAICIQSAFPNANIIINSSLCRSKDENNHEIALKLMENLGMEIRR